ncbi:ribosome releasing factor [Plasmodium vivax India VII]|uniref:Ribosome releasing factor n=1 Tax=Plasmodium vivax India VII TaxID=1077284 RepID=A0A0J9SGN6_PLAVI|nr:ribosome releasing factor [Plasmodium vivax India VII]
MALSRRTPLSKTVLCYLLLMAPLCSITTNALCDGFVLKRSPKLEAFLTGRDGVKKGLSDDLPRRGNLTKRSNAQGKNGNALHAHGKNRNTLHAHGKNRNTLHAHGKKEKKKEALLHVREVINRQMVGTGNEADEHGDEEEEEYSEGATRRGTSTPRAGQQKNHRGGSMTKGAPGGKNKTADLHLRSNIKIKGSLKEEQRQADGDEAVGRGTEGELLSSEDPLTGDAASTGDAPPDEQDHADEPVTEEDLDSLSKTCAEKMESVYSYIKKESYRFNLNSISNTLFENEKVKINDQLMTIKHMSHIRKKENLFIITPYDPYYVNFIYNHFVKEYKELKFYVKDRSLYAVVPPLSENLKNEIKIKIKEKVEDSKGTLRNVRKQMLAKLEKLRGRIGKDIYFFQRNHIQSLHDQTRKRIEALLSELR